MANMIARLGVLLGLDTAEFNKGLADAGRKLDEFVGQAQKGAAVVGAAFLAMATKATQYADEVNDIALANDLAIDSVVKLQNALVASGGQAENAGRLLSSFTSYIDKAAEGSFEAQQAFAKIGVSLQDIGKLSSQDLLNKTIQGLGAIEDPVTRNAKAFEMLGKAAKGVDFVNLAQQIQVTTSDAKEQADAIRALSDMWGRLEKAGIDFMLNFIKEFGPMLNQTVEYFSKMEGIGSVLVRIFKTVGETIVVVGANVAYVFTQIYKDAETIFKQLKALVSGDMDEFHRLHKEAIERAKKDRAELDAFEQRILGGAGGGRGFINPPLVGGGAAGRSTKAGTDPEEEKRKREAEAAAKRAADAHRRQLQEIELLSQAEVAYAKVVSSIVDYQNAQERRFELDQRLADLDRDRLKMADYEYDYRRALIQLTHESAEEIMRLNQMELLPGDRAKRIERHNELLQKQMDLLRRIRDTEEAKRTGDMAKGFMDAATEFFRTLPTEIEVGAAMFGSMMSNMNRALDNFVRTGKLNFKDFARSVIQDLIAIQLKAQAMRFFANLFGFGNPTTSSTGSVDYSFAGMKMNFGGPRAAGGAVSSDSAYMVGERGPELFVPRMSGMIIPNRAMGMMGSTTQVTNNYINAIDVKSFEERIMGSSNAVWAANLYAQKRLPLGAGRM